MGILVVNEPKPTATPTIEPTASPTPEPGQLGWWNLQWPPDMSIEAGQTTPLVFGQVWIDGVTPLEGPAPGLEAWLGVGDFGTTPTQWQRWVPAAFNGNVGNNDEFQANMVMEQAGKFSYAYRYRYQRGAFVYGDYDGSENGFQLDQMGILVVNEPKPTPTPTIEPTVSPTPEPTASASPTPEESPTASPTPTLTPLPTESPVPIPDSDGDGFADWFETQQGSNPQNPDDKPKSFDLNNDGQIQTVDALLAYRIIRGIITMPGVDLSALDVNLDGVVNEEDATIFYRWAIGDPLYPVIPIVPEK